MEIAGRTVVVTGAARGLGRHLVDEQALRPLLAGRGITVHGVYPAGIDTDMMAGIDAAKTPPAQVAALMLDGLQADLEDVFPDPNSQSMSQIWWSDPKAFERAFSGV
jgi:NAD(P)-dependent dehydrogenase (short-subunit alcohol dehydrogenase family)